MAIDVTKTISDNLDPNRRYAVRVRAVNNFGLASPWSDTFTFNTTDDSGKPGIPADVEISAAIRSLILQWTPVTDTDFDHYEIHVNQGVGDFTPTEANMVSRIRQSSFEIINKYWTGSAWADLVPGTTYSVKMRAVDVANNYSDYTNFVSATTGYVTNSDIQVGTLTADRILAGSITTEQLAALTFDVGKYMRSFNFDGGFDANGLITNFGTQGWALDGGGTGVFSSGIFRGTLEIGSNRRILIDASADGQITFDNQTPLLENPTLSTSVVGTNETLFFQGPKKNNSVYNTQLIFKADNTTGVPEIQMISWQDATPNSPYKAGQLVVTPDSSALIFDSADDALVRDQATIKVYKQEDRGAVYIASGNGTSHQDYSYFKMEETNAEGAVIEMRTYQDAFAATPSYSSVKMKSQANNNATFQIFNRGFADLNSFSELLMSSDPGTTNAEAYMKVRSALAEAKIYTGWSSLTAPKFSAVVDDPVNNNRIAFDGTIDSNSPVFQLSTKKAGTTVTGCILPLIGSTAAQSVTTNQHFMQSGFTSGTTDGSGDLTVTLPVTYPTASWSIVAVSFSTTALMAQPHTNTTSSFKIRFFNNSGIGQAGVSAAACWFVFGV